MGIASDHESFGLTIAPPVALVEPVKVADWDQLTDRTPIAGFVDGVDELDATLRSAIEIHLRDCEDCRSVLEQLRVIVSLAASVGDHDQNDSASMSRSMREQLMM